MPRLMSFHRMKRLALATTLLLGAMAANAALVLRPQSVIEPPQGDTHADIGERKLVVPRALMRDPAQMGGGRLDRLDIVLGLTDFSPLPVPDAKTPEKAPPERLAIVITPAQDGLSSIDMFGKVYARFLSGETQAAPAGLMLRHFREKTPYEDRELYLGVGTGRTFVALCPRPAAPGAIKTPDTSDKEPCVTTFRLAGLDMALRFPASHLGQWRRITETAFTLLEQMVQEDGSTNRVALPEEK
jgi:hypothetical protein